MKTVLPPSDGALEAPAQVQSMFGRIAGRYDLANALLSGGMDWFWRRRAARIVQAWRPARLLDLATGSGVLAATLARACPGALVIGADFCLPMLQRAQTARGLRRLVVADAMRLPFADGTFDAVTVAFGLRNMPSYLGALREMRRTLRPGGHVLILDFSVPNGWWRELYRWYLHAPCPGSRAWFHASGEPTNTSRNPSSDFRVGADMLRLLTGAGFDDAPRDGVERWDRLALYRDGGGYSIQLRKLYCVASITTISVASKITGSAAAIARAIQKTGRGKTGWAVVTAGVVVVVVSMMG